MPFAQSGTQLPKFVTDRRPMFAEVDPYNYYIDRNSADNVVAIVVTVPKAKPVVASQSLSATGEQRMP